MFRDLIRHSRRLAGLILLVATAAGTALAQTSTRGTVEPIMAADVRQALEQADVMQPGSTGNTSATQQAAVFRVNTQVMTPVGRVAVRLVFTLDSLLRDDRRVIVLVPGTLANGAAYYDVQVSGFEGFDAAAVLARQSFIAALPDLPGTGGSDRPEDGRAVSIETDAMAVRAVAQTAGLVFEAPRIDIYGETGVGGNVALRLARESWVRTVTGSGMLYLEPGQATLVLFTPEFGALLDSLPGGYLPQTADQIAPFFPFTPAPVREAAVAAVLGPPPGTIPTGAFYQLRAQANPTPPPFMVGPIVDPRPAVAPGFFLQGDADVVAVPGDTAHLAADYGSAGGGHAISVTLTGGSHLSRYDAGVG
ncbi:MAG TPA: hypothetical protein VKE70_17345, partial [Candidatus Solibacter sp.]|nr:hypothetical protein [Candidatus Solibacter sp.]